MNMIINEIKEHVTIMECLEEYTNARHPYSGSSEKRYVTRCPLHNDGTFSMTIYTTNNRWKCTNGCGEGDVIDLVSMAKKISRIQAINLLAIDLGYHPSELPLNEGIHPAQIQEIKKLASHCKASANQLQQLGFFLSEEVDKIYNWTEPSEYNKGNTEKDNLPKLFQLFFSENIQSKLIAMRGIEGMIKGVRKSIHD